ncbi:hypothetical protein UlMin_024073 [Ulmus minor]
MKRKKQGKNSPPAKSLFAGWRDGIERALENLRELLTQTCFNKCGEKVGELFYFIFNFSLLKNLCNRRYKESELNMGENNCIDRCVSKYWHVTNLVG